MLNSETFGRLTGYGYQAFTPDRIEMPNILIVEDEPLIALDLDAVMEDAGFHVVGIVPSMAGALKIAAQTHIDVALMDISLAGEGDGIEAAKRLRQEFDVASLFVSAEITERNRAMALEWQPVGFIGKPYQAQDIIDAILSAQET